MTDELCYTLRNGGQLRVTCSHGTHTGTLTLADGRVLVAQGDALVDILLWAQAHDREVAPQMQERTRI